MGLMYTFQLNLKQTEGGDLGGQNALTIVDGRWSICSSNVGLFGMKGLYSFTEKVGEAVQCTNFYDQGVPADNATKAMFRFLIFQGGTDYKAWDVGKSGDGLWVNMPEKFKGLLEKPFRWTIWMIDGRDKPLDTP